MTHIVIFFHISIGLKHAFLFYVRRSPDNLNLKCIVVDFASSIVL